MNYLEAITLTLPNFDSHLNSQIMSFFSRFETTLPSRKIDFLQSDENYFPKISLQFSDVPYPRCSFLISDKTVIDVEISNTTGEEKSSPHSYTPIDIHFLVERLSNFYINKVDHIGFNLPWFSQGVHPQISFLRKELADKSLYHLFPGGEPWDFILPGSVGEISGAEPVDYQISQWPKFEIVSFDKCSTPLIQFDLQLNSTFENLTKLFPEGIQVPEMKNIWVYIHNPYFIDTCFVLNEPQQEDWAPWLKKGRLTVGKI